MRRAKFCRWHSAPATWPSIATVSAWRDDASEFIEIQIDDGLQGRGGSGVAEIIRQAVVPGGVFGLQGEQSGDQVIPVLRAGAPVDRPPIGVSSPRVPPW